MRRVILGAAAGRRQRSLSPALWPDPASNVGRALQKGAWAGAQLGKTEPRNGGGEQPKPNAVQAFPYLPLLSFPTWEMRERTKTFYLSCARWSPGESLKPLLTALGVQGPTRSLHGASLPLLQSPLPGRGSLCPSFGGGGERGSTARRKLQPEQTFPMVTHRPGTP